MPAETDQTSDRGLDAKVGHRERLREKFLKNGLAKFTDEEVLELLLIFGTPRRDCKQAARDLFQKFGSIRSVFEAEPECLSQIKGVGPNNIVAIKFIQDVAGRFLEQSLLGRDYLASSSRVFAYLRHHMENLDKEAFKTIYLDSANGVLAVEELSRGSVGGTVVHSREVIERALTLRASGLVFAHNHPSGRPQPSPDDFRLTRQLLHAAHMVEIKVLDHLIVGKGDQYYSFRDQGLLAKYEKEIKHFYHGGG